VRAGPFGWTGRIPCTASDRRLISRGCPTADSDIRSACEVGRSLYLTLQLLVGAVDRFGYGVAAFVPVKVN